MVPLPEHGKQLDIIVDMVRVLLRHRGLRFDSYHETTMDLPEHSVRKLGSRRKSFCGTTVRLEPDVAELFPNDEAVNEALRLLIRVMQENQALAPKIQTSTSLERTDESP